MAASENGVRIQICAALIASPLIVPRTGRKPTKRTYELLHFYLARWVSEEEPGEHLGLTRKA